MPEQLQALAVVLAVLAAGSLWVAWAGRRAAQRDARDLLATFGAMPSGVPMLAFTTPDCRSCRTIQGPALRALTHRHPDRIAVEEVNALEATGLARRFGILTVPSTVVIGPGGELRAVNHGAVSAERLAWQTQPIEGAPATPESEPGP